MNDVIDQFYFIFGKFLKILNLALRYPPQGVASGAGVRCVAAGRRRPWNPRLALFSVGGGGQKWNFRENETKFWKKSQMFHQVPPVGLASSGDEINFKKKLVNCINCLS